jgi:hypothetical protein
VHFVTRERVHVDRIATAWAVRRFVDPRATFEFVARTRDLDQIQGIPFDIRGAELGHHNGRCTLEALIEKYELSDEPLQRMARIVRAADQPQDDPEPAVAAGVRAIFDGIRDAASSDTERLEQGFVVCDALYVYCRNDPDSATAF